jgi:hypothetical protein
VYCIGKFPVRTHFFPRDVSLLGLSYKNAGACHRRRRIRRRRKGRRKKEVNE